MSNETKNITILSSVGAILVTLLIFWGVCSIKADRAKAAKTQSVREQTETVMYTDAPKRKTAAVFAPTTVKKTKSDHHDYSTGALVALSHYIRDFQIIHYDTIDYYPKMQIKLLGQRYRITGFIVAKRYYDTLDAIDAGGRGGEVITVAYDVIMKYIPTVYSEHNDPSKIYNWKIVADNSDTTVFYPK